MFCEQQYKNNSNKMSRVETDSFCDNIEKRCKEKKHIDFERKIGNDFRKLPAFEARYHNSCLLCYMKADYKRKSNDADPHQAPFTKLLDYVSFSRIWKSIINDNSLSKVQRVHE